jgi:hypothetical protein
MILANKGERVGSTLLERNAPLLPLVTKHTCPRSARPRGGLPVLNKQKGPK